MGTSLKSQQHIFSSTEEQIARLENGMFQTEELPSFKRKLETMGYSSLRPTDLEIFQINVGYMCNQTCKHCHVDAGPDRKEIMTRETMNSILELLRSHKVKTVDLTGGAPEMNPDFHWFVEEIRKTEVEEIIVRSNLTILLTRKHELTPEFFKKNKIRVVSSLPFYQPEKTDRQRGQGVFQKSIEALQKLNALGYGRDEELILDLVYNPSGAFLPADQQLLENDFKKELSSHYGIDFNSLLTITNLPISRFLDFLVRTENYEEYMDTLVQAFNPLTVEGLMCRNTLSVGWDGYLYDCDFNQMLGLKINHSDTHVSDLNFNTIQNREVVINNHCFGCTAGAGSSCQGSMV